LGVFVSLKEKWVPHSFAEAGTWFFSFRERVGSTICASPRCAQAFGREEFLIVQVGTARLKSGPDTNLQT
jgi:hypothetical protein